MTRAIVPGYVPVGGGWLHFLATGEGDAAVVLLHETPLSAHSFEPAMRLIGDHIRVIAFDTPGYGASSPLAPPVAIERYADRLWEGIAASGVRRVALCGIHTGAAIAIELARRTPATGPELRALILSGVPVIDGDQRGKLGAYLRSRTGAIDDEATVLHGWHDRRRRWFNAPADLLVRAFADELRVFARRDAAYHAVLAYDLPAAAKMLQVPVMLLNGRHDSLGASDATSTRALFPGAELAILDDRGGQLPWSAPDDYAHHVLRFVRPLLIA